MNTHGVYRNALSGHERIAPDLSGRRSTGRYAHEPRYTGRSMRVSDGHTGL